MTRIFESRKSVFTAFLPLFLPLDFALLTDIPWCRAEAASREKNGIKKFPQEFVVA